MSQEIDWGAMAPSWSQTTVDYVRYRLGFPSSMYDRLRDRSIGLSGQRILDIGTGTGTIARTLAAAGADVTAVDRDAGMLAAGQQLAAASGLNITWTVATAEDLPLADETFDVVFAGQCWHWFQRTQAAQEMWRVLKPGGTLVICHYDWLPVSGNVVELTEKLIQAHNPNWTAVEGYGIYPRWFRDLDEAGFDGIVSFSYDEPGEYSHEAWRGRIRASAGVSGSLEVAAVAAFDAELATKLKGCHVSDPMQVPHRVFVVYGQKNGGARPNQALNWER